ncbi:hypothetical protein GCM10027445_29540 [Amycolatopsis endophytica]|uniref:Helix-hairpin-helix protein n=1 Tax=Amycolatopsis endophytica TaxID=860233 RepID=A0A853BBA6_9PSEU|nr:helix-hairpin-helix domain-containing protein [Amycolatopsis endophytica]NYI91951.1 hypothetical protein [Amycolatopsis endophytica]
MTSAAHFRTASRSLPEAVEEGGAFSVGGAVFAALEDQHVHLRLPTAEVDEVLSGHPSAIRTRHGVRVPLDGINGQQLNHWLRRAWLAHAPEPLATRERAAHCAEPGDLPRTIGRPATRALASAGITTLDEIAALTEAELLALHGVGPKAVRILRETLAETGRSLDGQR